MQPVDVQGVLSPWQPGLFSLTLYTAIVIGLTMALLFLSRWLGQHRPNHEKLRVYESGIIPTGQARLRYPVPFFMVAIFFLIFDVEGAYIFSCGGGQPSIGLGRLVPDRIFYRGADCRFGLYLGERRPSSGGPKRD